jgi:very-short-patch-repair endonuclease
VHVLARHAAKHRGVVVHKARALHPRDTTRHHGIPTTTPARTLLDLADHLPPRALERALAKAEVLRLTNRGELRALLERSPGRRGALAKILARDAQAPTRSELEERFLAFLDAHHLPRPLVNRRVLGYEVDFHWPAHRLVVELDGYAFHAHRQAFEDDRARDATLQAHGWRVVRLTDRRLGEHARAVARLLERLLGQPAGAGSRSALTSAGSPRSGNGTSIASKSRGTTVSGKIARASSRTSRGK